MGWFKEGRRHSLAKSRGNAGPIYRGSGINLNLRLPKIDLRRHKTSRQLFESIATIKNRLPKGINGDIEKSLEKMRKIGDSLRKKEKANHKITSNNYSKRVGRTLKKIIKKSFQIKANPERIKKAGEGFKKDFSKLSGKIGKLGERKKSRSASKIFFEEPKDSIFRSMGFKWDPEKGIWEK